MFLVVFKIYYKKFRKKEKKRSYNIPTTTKSSPQNIREKKERIVPFKK
jgi:hypothetical protein